MGEYLREIAVGQENGVYFIRPCHSFQDLNTLQESELYQLLCILTDYFDEVVCDMNTAFAVSYTHLLSACCIIWESDDSAGQLHAIMGVIAPSFLS